MQCEVTVEEVFQAYYDCRRLKRNTWNALVFERKLERNLMDLYHELRDGAYSPGRSMCFIVEHPKVREVWAADFRDRIVHHILYNRVSQRFYKAFIVDSFACIPGRGTLAAATRVRRQARRITQNHTVPAWRLQADIANFFVSVDKQILDGLIERRIPEPWLLWLARKILHHNPTTNVFVRSPAHLMSKVPHHKSLFNAKGNGMPIGNLTSQFFANVYLDPLDQFAKHVLKIKHYARYVDDVLAMGLCGSFLHDAYQRMREFVAEKLNLAFHPDKTSINTVANGINFVGYIIRPWAMYVRRSTVGSFYYRVRTPGRNADMDSLRATVNSYLGMMRHANGWKARCRMGQFVRDTFNVRMSPGMTRMLAA